MVANVVKSARNHKQSLVFYLMLTQIETVFNGDNFLRFCYRTVSFSHICGENENLIQSHEWILKKINYSLLY